MMSGQAFQFCPQTLHILTLFIQNQLRPQINSEIKRSVTFMALLQIVRQSGIMNCRRNSLIVCCLQRIGTEAEHKALHCTDTEKFSRTFCQNTHTASHCLGRISHISRHHINGQLLHPGTGQQNHL